MLLEKVSIDNITIYISLHTNVSVVHDLITFFTQLKKIFFRQLIVFRALFENTINKVTKCFHRTTFVSTSLKSAPIQSVIKVRYYVPQYSAERFDKSLKTISHGRRTNIYISTRILLLNKLYTFLNSNDRVLYKVVRCYTRVL